MNSYLEYQCELDLTNAIDWQRSNAEILLAWLIKKTEWYAVNHCDFWNVWFDNIFNLDTANDFGLSVWSIILDENTYGVTPASPQGFKAWGFGPNRKNFNNGNFGTNDDSGYNFTTEQRRILLKMKAYILHMSGSVHGEGVLGINEALRDIFGEGTAFCVDNRDMSFTYIFYDSSFSPLASELYARDLLPRPVGINIKLVLDWETPPWGFGEFRSNFGSANFYDGIIASS